jgi:hypothetical protein
MGQLSLSASGLFFTHLQFARDSILPREVNPGGRHPRRYIGSTGQDLHPNSSPGGGPGWCMSTHAGGAYTCPHTRLQARGDPRRGTHLYRRGTRGRECRSVHEPFVGVVARLLDNRHFARPESDAQANCRTRDRGPRPRGSDYPCPFRESPCFSSRRTKPARDSSEPIPQFLLERRIIPVYNTQVFTPARADRRQSVGMWRPCLGKRRLAPSGTLLTCRFPNPGCNGLIE